jgi:hypothetical protein
MLRAKILGKILDGLTNDFKISDDRINRLLVHKERSFGQATGIRRDLSRGFENVFQVNPKIPGHRWFLVE